MRISLFSGTRADQSRNIDKIVDVSFNDLGNHITRSMWAPGVFRDNVRSIPTFISTDLMVLDIDSGLTLNEANILFSSYAHIIATTKSHQIEKNGEVCDRFRVILKLDKPITNDLDYKSTWHEVQKICPAIDPACKDSSRFFFPSSSIHSLSPNGRDWPVTQRVETTRVLSSAPPVSTKKGKLSKRAMDFLSNGAENGTWHNERNNFVRECKQNNYSFEEMQKLFNVYHTPDSTDEFQFKDVWDRGVKHAPRVQDNDKEALYNLILRSKLIIDISQPSNTILVDFTEGLSHDVHIQTIQKTLGKETYNDYTNTNLINAMIDYNPHQAEPLSNTDQGVDVYNTYVPPTWKRRNFFYGDPISEARELPEIYKHFFTHLTDGHSPSQEYLLDWIANSLKQQNFTILTAIGKQGVGKGTLGDILQLLHGPKNFAKVRDQVFKAQFNSQLGNKTLVYVDEIDLKTKDAQDRIKDVVNPEIEIEQKGIDAKSLRNYASFYISSNTMDAIKLEGDDRRFSIIQLTDKKIIHTDGYNKGYVGALKLEENVCALARFLYHRKITNSMTEPFKSERYERVREAGLADWELFVVEEWAPKHVGQEILINELQVEIERARILNQAPGRRKIEALADKYPEKFRVVNSTHNVRKLKILT